ncbi:hypothetical protein PENSPDRAFT_668916 [Peniophora sp. CONT]|nr:hypothetical protein PENSPDRAFT_668916 [Peniophora sp. CONT]
MSEAPPNENKNKQEYIEGVIGGAEGEEGDADEKEGSDNAIDGSNKLKLVGFEGGSGAYYDFIANKMVSKFGWDDPLCVLKKDKKVADEGKWEEVKATTAKAEALAWKQATTADEAAAVEEAKRKDSVIKVVCKKVKDVLEGEYCKREKKGTLRIPPKVPKVTAAAKSKGMERAAEAGVPAQVASGSAAAPASATAAATPWRPVGARTGAGADILKLFMEKAPRRVAANSYWVEELEKTGKMVELDAEVDSQWEQEVEKAKAEGRVIPPRQGVKNSVVSEWYNRLDKSNKAGVVAKVESHHKGNMQAWLARKSEGPESPEDAAEFLQGARELMADLANFIAARGSAVCVWFTYGPKGAAYWSGRPLLPRLEQSTDLGPSTPHPDVDKTCDVEPPVPVPVGLSLPDELPSALLPPSVRLRTSEDSSGSAKQLSASKSTQRSIVKATAKNQEVTSQPQAPEAPEKDKGPLTADELPARNGAPIANKCKTATEEFSAYTSVFTYKNEDDVGFTDVANKYDNEWKGALEKLVTRKDWVERSKTDEFFRNLLEKMKGGVDVGLACKVALAYLSLENSNAEDGFLVLRANAGGAVLPEYVAGFSSSQRSWTSRWHKIGETGKKRTPSIINCDVATTLPLQWAMLQPDTRRDLAGKLTRKADAGFVWPENGICPESVAFNACGLKWKRENGEGLDGAWESPETRFSDRDSVCGRRQQRSLM